MSAVMEREAAEILRALVARPRWYEVVINIAFWTLILIGA